MSRGTSTTIRGTTATNTRTTTRAHRSRPGVQARALVLLLAWTLFAFAGAYLWALLPLAAGALLLGLVVRPPIGRPPHRLLDLALIAALLVIAVQLVPLPPGLRLALSPRVDAVDQALWIGGGDPTSLRPLSLDPGATRLSLLLWTGLACLFWSARALLSRGGVRTVSRGVAWIGLALAVVGLAQHATSPRLLYWSIPTVFGAPFTPYRNRNDFAGWLVMAAAATLGYITARIHSRRDPSGRRPDLHDVADSTAVWLAGSLVLMSAALMVSLSRSALLGAAAAVAAFAWLSRRRMGRAGRLGLLAGIVVLVVIALTYVSGAALSRRIDETVIAGIGGRRAIWRDSWRLLGDFRLTGVGADAYERAMLVYQQTTYGNGFRFNHAHNQYLQLAVQGGLLLSIPVAVALAAGARQILQRLRADRTPTFWVRAGAASALVAVSVHSLFDVALRMPANAALFVVLAAVAMHDSE